MNLNRVLHLVARVALRAAPPIRAKRAVDLLAAALPPLTSTEDALRAYLALGAAGTCLSRALTIAARFPKSEVVIGLSTAPTPGPFAAHAWVEHGGETIDPRPDQRLEPRTEIARFR